MKISSIFVAFLENMNFKRVLLLAYYSLSSKVQGLHMLCYIGYWPLNLIFLNGQLGSYWPYTIVCYVVIVLREKEIVAKLGGRGIDHSFLLSFLTDRAAGVSKMLMGIKDGFKGNDFLISWMLAPLGCFLCLKNNITKERLL